MGQTPQQKKAIDMRGTGMGLREIAENLNISRREVELLLSIDVSKVEDKLEEKAAVKTSEKKAEKSQVKSKGK